jgi:hypothetical protein
MFSVMNRIRAFLTVMSACVFFLCTHSLVAQASVAATVVYAEGESYSVIRADGREEYHTWRDAEFIGQILFPGDSLLTDDGTFLELRMEHNGSVVRVSENTSFQMTGETSENETRLAVGYGRVRAAVRRLSGDQTFAIRGRTVVGGVRGTEFGVSVVATPEGDINDTVFVLEGEVAVRKTQDIVDQEETVEDASNDEIVVTAGNFVSVQRREQPLVVEAIGSDLRIELERDAIRSRMLQPSPADRPIDRPDVEPSEPDRSDVTEIAVPAGGALSRVVFRAQSGGGLVAAAGPDVYSRSGIIRFGIVGGATFAGERTIPAVAANVSLEQTFGLFAGALGVTGYLAADSDAVTAAVGPTLGLSLSIGRRASLFLDNTIYYNAYPDASLPFVYSPALGVRL